MTLNPIHIILPILISLSFLSCNGQGNPSKKDIPIKIISTGNPVSNLDDRIWDIYQDSKGNYWFASNGNGVYLYDDENLKLFTTYEGLIDNTIRGIQEDSLGNIFIETPSGVSKYDGQSFSNLVPIISENNQWKLSPNDLWFNCNGNANNVYRYDGQNLYQLELPKQDLIGVLGIYEEGMRYSPYTVFGIDKDKQGNIWFGTVIAGAFRFDGESFLWIGEKEISRLANGTEPGVRSILQDKDGNMWLSNFISKYKINPGNSPQYKKLAADHGGEEILDGISFFNSGLIDKNGDLWMTSYGGDVWKYDGEKLLHFPITNDEKEVLIISIYEDNNGVLWLGTDNDGVYKQEGETFEKFEF